MSADNLVHRPPASEVLPRVRRRRFGRTVALLSSVLALTAVTAAPAEASQGEVRTYPISARGQDTRTDIFVHKGETFTLSSYGKWTMNKDGLPPVDPNGHPNLSYGNDYCKVLGNTYNGESNVNYGKLIVKIDGPEYHDPHYVVGTGPVTITSPVDGPLVGFPNDRNDEGIDCRGNNEDVEKVILVFQAA